MVQFIQDPTGRFPRRPYYEENELEAECDALIAAYYRQRGFEVPFLIPTDDLTKIIEAEGCVLDLYAELESHIDGRTDFRSQVETEILINRDLSRSKAYENRFRTTLTHELAHVKFHEPLFRSRASQLPLFSAPEETTASCHRDNIVGAGMGDWLEWQAGFASTAMLIPKSKAFQLLGTLQIGTPVGTTSPAGIYLIQMVQKSFQVSSEAARIRLSRLGLLVDDFTSYNKRLSGQL